MTHTHPLTTEPQPTPRLTAEERAEARRLTDEATPGPWHYEEERYSAKCVIGLKPQDDRWLAHCQPALNGEGNGRFIAASRTLIPRLLADLEAAERERDEAREEVKTLENKLDGELLNLARRVMDLTEAEAERDTARAQVETLAEALRWYADEENYTHDDAGTAIEDVHFSVDRVSNDNGARARAALKAAGVET